jgi:1-acyl-sn-glycerol-3-phosphate acyltransferase
MPKAYQFIAYYASLVLFAVLSSGLNLFCLLFGWLPGLAGRERFFQRLVHLDFALFVRCLSLARLVRVRYEGFAGWPARPGLVVAANHPGMLDIGWLLARLPEALCIYKPNLGHSPLFGITARCAGYLPSDRGHHLLREAAAKVASGQTLLVFPEGTRSRGGVLNPLKPGFAVIARVAQAPIQLVLITSDSDLLVKGRPWWRAPRLPATVTLAVGPCLPPPGADPSGVVAEIEAWFRRSAGTPAARACQEDPARLPARP